MPIARVRRTHPKVMNSLGFLEALRLTWAIQSVGASVRGPGLCTDEPPDRALAWPRAADSGLHRSAGITLPGHIGRSDVLIGRWTTATLRMTCLTGGLTPCSAATGIPGRPATSSSPTCRARAAPTKASPGTPWSGARRTAAAQPGTARGTTRMARRPPAPPAFPTQDLPRLTEREAASTVPQRAKRGAISLR